MDYDKLVDLCQKEIPELEEAEGSAIIDRYVTLSSAVSGVKAKLRSTPCEKPGLLKAIFGAITRKPGRQRDEQFINHMADTEQRLNHLTDIQRNLDRILTHTYGPQYGIDDFVLMRDDTDALRVAWIEDMTLDKVTMHYLGPEGPQKSNFKTSAIKCKLVQTFIEPQSGPVILYQGEKIVTIGFMDPENPYVLGHMCGGFQPDMDYTDRKDLMMFALQPASAPMLSMTESKLIAALNEVDMDERPFPGANNMLEVYVKGIRVEGALDIVFERDMIKEGEKVVAYVDHQFVVGQVLKGGERLHLETALGRKNVPYHSVPCILAERPVRKYRDIPDGTPVAWQSKEGDRQTEYLGFIEHYTDIVNVHTTELVRLRDSWPDGKIVETGSTKPVLTRLFPVRKSCKMVGKGSR